MDYEMLRAQIIVRYQTGSITYDEYKRELYELRGALWELQGDILGSMTRI